MNFFRDLIRSVTKDDDDEKQQGDKSSNENPKSTAVKPTTPKSPLAESDHLQPIAMTSRVGADDASSSSSSSSTKPTTPQVARDLSLARPASAASSSAAASAASSSNQAGISSVAAASPSSSASSSSSTAASSSSCSFSSAASPSSPTSISDLWLTLLRLRECFVYKLPPRVGLTPYQAEAWKLDQPLETCELRVVAKENDLVLRFYTQGHVLFAQSVELNCLEAERSIPLSAFLESVRDSSRYFVIRVKSPKGDIVSLGIGVRERTSAFDLLATLQDRIKTIQRHQGLDDSASSLLLHGNGGSNGSVNDEDGSYQPPNMIRNLRSEADEIALAEARLAAQHRDYSLAEGQRITVNLKRSSAVAAAGDSKQNDKDAIQAAPGGPTIRSKKKRASQQSSIGVVASSSGGFMLAPPPPAVDSLDPNFVDENPAGETNGDSMFPQQAAPTNLSPTLAPQVSSSALEGVQNLQLNESAQVEGQPSAAPLAASASSNADAGSAADPDEDEFSDFASAQ